MIERRPLYRAGAAAALLQLGSLLVMGVVAGTLGPRPETAGAFFEAYAEQGAAVALRGDLVILLLLLLPYLATAPAVAAGLWPRAPLTGVAFVVGSFATVIGAIATESTFALLHLADRWTGAGEAERALLVAAGEAVVASDLWNSTAGYCGGLLLQGTGVLVSVAMLRGAAFSRVTAVAGLLGNGLDLVQHVLHPVLPEVAGTIQLGMGPFYVVWFPMLARDLLRLAARVGHPTQAGG